MAGFDDLLAVMPYLATEVLEAGQGSSWVWEYEARDNDGALVSWTGITVAGEIRDKNGALILTIPVTLPSSGVVRCAAGPDTTGPVAPGRYFHEVELTRTSGGAKVKVVGCGDSIFEVKGQLF